MLLLRLSFLDYTLSIARRMVWLPISSIIELKFGPSSHHQTPPAPLWFNILSFIVSFLGSSPSEDRFVWRATNNGEFSSSSLYKFMNLRGVSCSFAPILWSLCIPQKIKCFLWLAWWKKLHIREVLGNKLGTGLGSCVNYGQALEAIDHVFSTCQIFSTI